jgi:hypothetical protein
MRRLFLAVALALCAGPALADALQITEFQGAPQVAVNYQAATTPANAVQNITIVPNSSVQSAAFAANTGLIRLVCITDVSTSVCLVNIGGTNPTASGTSMRLSSGQTEYFRVVPGDKLAVYQNGPI